MRDRAILANFRREISLKNSVVKSKKIYNRKKVKAELNSQKVR